MLVFFNPVNSKRGRYVITTKHEPGVPGRSRPAA